MKQPNFKKSIIDYFENRKKTKKNKTPKNKKIGGLMSSLSDSAPVKTKRVTNRKEKERRFIKYHMTPLTKSDTKLNFKPSPYNVPEMETATNQNVVPEPKSKEKVKTEIRSNKKSKSKQNNTTPITEKRKKELEKGLEEIMMKAKGAYYSSGSRPNQTAFSWGLGRIASVLQGGPSRKIDKKIVDRYKIPKI